MPYTQLSFNDRYVICHMNLAGHSQAQIAKQLKRSPGTISRELRRNLDPRGDYFYDVAQRESQTRRTQANQRYKLDDPELQSYIRYALAFTWSPEQIAGRLQLDFQPIDKMSVSHETIYRWVYRHVNLGGLFHRLLRRKQKRRKHRNPCKTSNRGGIPGRVGIEHRPNQVDTRERYGDWESDTVEGAKGKGLLVTHVERKSRYTLIRKIENKQADTFNHASLAAFKTIPGALRHTLTADNGTEFAKFKQLERRLDIQVYFADPYSPWQRGTNENTNGLIREFFHKGMDLTDVCHRQVAKAQRLLNNRPRKCLGYRTPREVLNKLPRVALRN
jgi:IS30 family transposase